jgi:hypothetical protein
MLRSVTPEITSRSAVASAAGVLLIATIVIVLDIRFNDGIDLVADVIGGIMVVVAALRLRGAIRGAEGMTTLLVVLALVNVPVTIVDTLTPFAQPIGYLGVVQVIGTAVLAWLLGRALAASEPDLAAAWRTEFQLLIWLAILPYVALQLLGTGTAVRLEVSFLLLLLLLMVIPFVYLLVVLSRTSRAPLEVLEPSLPSPDPAAP